MSQDAKINIELNFIDAELFKKFRQYQDDFNEFEKSGLFNFRNGEAKVSRDENGILRGIFLNLKMYDGRKNRIRRTTFINKVVDG